jgi:hypothetical protein
MKERPILFSGPMVRAILEGRKTQTRRPLRRQPNYTPRMLYVPYRGGKRICVRDDKNFYDYWNWCSYGVPGDRLWVRETWFQGYATVYRADHPECQPSGYSADKWRPSIFMPRWASRLTLEITDVRVQQVQAISEADANAEGCDLPARDQDWSQCRRWYQDLWDSINAKRGCGWATNPWVWALTFRRINR